MAQARQLGVHEVYWVVNTIKDEEGRKWVGQGSLYHRSILILLRRREKVKLGGNRKLVGDGEGCKW